jgi:hypothetical protein
MADLIRFIMDIDASAITNTTISIQSDINIAKSEIIRPGTITVVAT